MRSVQAAAASILPCLPQLQSRFDSIPEELSRGGFAGMENLNPRKSHGGRRELFGSLSVDIWPAGRIPAIHPCPKTEPSGAVTIDIPANKDVFRSLRLATSCYYSACLCLLGNSTK